MAEISILVHIKRVKFLISSKQCCFNSSNHMSCNPQFHISAVNLGVGLTVIFSSVLYLQAVS